MIAGITENPLNQVILMGTLARDPQMGYLPNQTAATRLGVIVEDAVFECCAFGRQAEVLSQWLHKDSNVLVDGRLQTQRWEIAAGVMHEDLRVVVNHVQFLRDE